MKKYFCFSIVMLLCLVLFSQKTMRKESADRYAYKWKAPITDQDSEERRKANMEPIVKRIYDTLGYDYLEQHFYHNGNLYYQVPFINGKKTGVHEEYHPNGQLKYRRDRDGDGCDLISFDRFGDVSSTVICIHYNGELYYFQTGYFYGTLSSLIVHNYRYAIMAEFRWSDNKWVKDNHHAKPVKYANKLLKLYKKTANAVKSKKLIKN